MGVRDGRASLNTALTSTVRGRGEVATKVEISGRASGPETSPWALAVGLIQNALVKAIAHEFEPQAKDASP